MARKKKLAGARSLKKDKPIYKKTKWTKIKGKSAQLKKKKGKGIFAEIEQVKREMR